MCLPAGNAVAPGMGGATGGGGLAGMMSQLMQSPAMQHMADSLADRANSRGNSQQQAAPDFGSFLQDMMPMVGQVQSSLRCAANAHSHADILPDVIAPSAVPALAM